MAFCIKQKNRAPFGLQTDKFCTWHSASNKNNRAPFGLQTDKFCTFRVMDHNFGSLRRVSWQRSYPKPIDQFPTINL